MEENPYFTLFIDESTEHLQAMNDCMLKLENNASDSTIVQQIFRSAHTLKGMAATMGYDDLASLTHDMENVLDKIRNEQLQVNEHVLDVLFSSLDSLELMVSDITGGGTGKADVSSLVLSLQQILASSSSQSEVAVSVEGEQIIAMDNSFTGTEYIAMREAERLGMQVCELRVMIRRDSVLKSVRAYMVFAALHSFGEVIRSVPSVEEIERDEFDFSFTVHIVTTDSAEAIQSTVLNISEIEQVTVNIVHVAQLEQQPAQDNHLETQKLSSGSSQDHSEIRKSSRTIRVDLDRIDHLMNLFSELLIDRLRLEQLATEIKHPALTDNVEQISRLTTELQDIVMNLRMVPIQSVFNRFPRMIRDLARSLNKKVDLQIVGGETELDRTVIDEIGDPLVHLLRNSVDHGIESPDERLKLGKTETGTLHLRAMQSGNQVIIEVEEDGRGIRREQVLQKAIENNVIESNQVDALSDDEVYDLLFSPGFSTTEIVSDVSGRGVGLDVVRSNIRSLGGNVEVSSSVNKGSKFTIHLPLTLSVLYVMLIRLGTERYAVPLSSIVETMIVQRTEMKAPHGVEMIPYRDEYIPVSMVGHVFGCTVDQESQELNVLVVQRNDQFIALAVDEFIGQQEVVLKPLGNYLSPLFAISGATILGDGEVVLILNTNDLFRT